MGKSLSISYLTIRSWSTIFIFAFIALFHCGEFATAGEADLKAPRAEFQDPQFVFKPVPEGRKVVHHFVIRNSGNGTLFIKGVKTD